MFLAGLLLTGRRCTLKGCLHKQAVPVLPREALWNAAAKRAPAMAKPKRKTLRLKVLVGDIFPPRQKRSFFPFSSFVPCARHEEDKEKASFLASIDLLRPLTLDTPSQRTMSAVSRSLRTASKQLRFQPARLVANVSVRSASVGAARVTGSIYSARSNFSTSITRQSGAPNMASAAREYDPEVKDIADYVANKTIDSELAVS